MVTQAVSDGDPIASERRQRHGLRSRSVRRDPIRGRKVVNGAKQSGVLDDLHDLALGTVSMFASRLRPRSTLYRYSARYQSVP
jgi:hypothetical protein